MRWLCGYFIFNLPSKQQSLAFEPMSVTLEELPKKPLPGQVVEDIEVGL